MDGYNAALAEGAFADGLQSHGQFQLLQFGAAGEGIHADFLQGGGQLHRFQQTCSSVTDIASSDVGSAFTEHIGHQLRDAFGNHHVTAGTVIFPEDVSNDDQAVFIRQRRAIGEGAFVHFRIRGMIGHLLQSAAITEGIIANGCDRGGNGHFLQLAASSEGVRFDCFQCFGQNHFFQCATGLECGIAHHFDPCGNVNLLNLLAAKEGIAVDFLQTVGKYQLFRHLTAGKCRVTDVLQGRRQHHFLQTDTAGETSARHPLHALGDDDFLQTVAFCKSSAQHLQGRRQPHRAYAHFLEAVVGNFNDTLRNFHLAVGAVVTVQGLIENRKAMFIAQPSAAAEHADAHIFDVFRQAHFRQMVTAGEGIAPDGMHAFRNYDALQQVAIAEGAGFDHFQTFRQIDAAQILIAGVGIKSHAEHILLDALDTDGNIQGIAVAVIAQHHAIMDEKSVLIAQAFAALKCFQGELDAARHFNALQLCAVGKGTDAHMLDRGGQHDSFDIIFRLPAVRAGAEHASGNMGHAFGHDHFTGITRVHELVQNIQKDQKSLLVDQRGRGFLVVGTEGVIARLEHLGITVHLLQFVTGGEGTTAQIAECIRQGHFLQRLAAAKSVKGDGLQILREFHCFQFGAFFEGGIFDFRHRIRHFHRHQLGVLREGSSVDFRDAIGNDHIRVAAGIFDQNIILNFKHNKRSFCFSLSGLRAPVLPAL